MITQKDIDEMEIRFKEIFATKEELMQMKSDLLDKLDSILKEILASREEQTIMVHQIASHGDRITTLETASTS